MIGLAISTHRRPDVLAKSLSEWAKHMPDVLVVNHDRDGEGVAATKNAGIRALMDAGCDNEEILAHCRSAGPHVRGCWVVDLLLQKE